jgi:hypothetical protein
MRRLLLSMAWLAARLSFGSPICVISGLGAAQQDEAASEAQHASWGWRGLGV